MALPRHHQSVLRWWTAIREAIQLLDLEQTHLDLGMGTIEFRADAFPLFSIVVVPRKCFAIDGPVTRPDCVVLIDPESLGKMLAGANPQRPVFKVSGSHQLFRSVFTLLQTQHRPAYSPWATALRQREAR